MFTRVESEVNLCGRIGGKVREWGEGEDNGNRDYC